MAGSHRKAPRPERVPEPVRKRPSTSARTPATQNPRTDADVLAFQSSVGNLALSRLMSAGAVPVQRKGPKGTADKPVTSATPGQIVSWGVQIKKGAEGADQQRPMTATGNKVFKGDTALVTIEFAGDVQNGGHGGIAIQEVGSGIVSAASWKTPRIHQLTVTFTKVGRATFNMNAGAPAEVHQESFDVVADLADFQAACSQAIATVGARYDAAIGTLNKASVAYNTAYKKQESALKDVDAEEKLVGDLLWGAVFAAGGGLAGGMVGGRLKDVFTAARKGGADIGSVGEGGLTDTAKDLTKFLVRSSDKIKGLATGGQQGSGPSTKGDSTSDPSAHKSDKKPSEADPFEFLTEHAANLLTEKASLQAALAKVIGEARAARDANSKADFDQDPLAVVEAGTDLVTIANELSTNYKEHLAALWASWLENFGYVVGNRYDNEYDQDIYFAKYNVGRKLKKKVMAAAAECGQDGEEWLRKYTPKAEEKARKAAAAEAAKHGNGTTGFTSGGP